MTIMGVLVFAIYTIMNLPDTRLSNLEASKIILGCEKSFISPEFLVRREIKNKSVKVVSVKVASRGEERKEYVGEFKLTFYCPCRICCGRNAKGITFSGTHVQEGRTIAVDSDVIPIGSKVYIDGIGERIAEDTGSAINGHRIDIYCSKHQEALDLGVREGIKVWIIK